MDDESRGEDTYPKPARFVFETAVDELGYVVDEMHRGVCTPFVFSHRLGKIFWLDDDLYILYII